MEPSISQAHKIHTKKEEEQEEKKTPGIELSVQNSIVKLKKLLPQFKKITST